jgi:hypothetical protein
MSRASLSMAVMLLLIASQAHAQGKAGKGIRLWNLTTSTITGFQLSPGWKAAMERQSDAGGQG